jgi:hypothetical protein
MIPPALYAYVPSIAKGIKARDILTTALAEWVQDGMSALDEGIIRDVAETGPPDGLSTTEVATLLLIDLWALQANTTYAAASLLLYALQSPILPAILEEIDVLPTKSGSSTPDLRSSRLRPCTQETIRLTTSSYTIRTRNPSRCPPPLASSSSLVARTSSARPAPRTCLTPYGARTRPHGKATASWRETARRRDRKRCKGCMDSAGVFLSCAFLTSLFHLSLELTVCVECEGRHLAAAELKSLLALALSAFHITPLYPTSADGRTPTTSPHTWFSVKGSTGSAIAPARAAGRAGMGVLQFGGADVIVRVTSRFT